MRTVTLEKLKELVAPILTTSDRECPTELYQELIIDACRFYGASLYLQSKFDAGDKRVFRVSNKSSKSYADDFLVRKHGVDRYWARAATNRITHHNLPPVSFTAEDSLADFMQEDFYRAYVQIFPDQF